MIDGIVIKELKSHPDERGRVMEILRCDDPFFKKFLLTVLQSCGRLK